MELWGLLGNAAVLVAVLVFGWRVVAHLDGKIERWGERLSGQLDDLRAEVAHIKGSRNPVVRLPANPPDGD